MNAFQKIVDAELRHDRTLGVPALNLKRRLDMFYKLAGGKGFRHPAKSHEAGDFRKAKRKANRERYLKGFEVPQHPKYWNAPPRNRLLETVV